MEWFLVVVKERYAQFAGRARRSEYWYYYLFYILIFIGLAIVDGISGTLNAALGVGLLSGVFGLAMLIPSLAVSVRRLHDTGRSGWWLLIGLVPVIGAIVLLVFVLLDSAPGANQYGANPKDVAA
ncbi:MAG: DUF805 domain-containing protein [Proteobacteria bacterium]|nr:DUF805 domain-containing protein [Pseudomonadota bacterium]